MFGPDSFGPVAIPLVAPSALGLLPSGKPVTPGDPALAVLADFLTTYLQTDANATAQWNVAGVAPGQPVVTEWVVGRPDDKGYNLDVKILPAIFVFRDGSKMEWLGDDWGIDRSVVKIQWVLRQAKPNQQAPRLPMANAIAKVVQDGIELGRTPSWVVPGDSDPLAASQGSLFSTTAGFVSLWMTAWKPFVVRVVDVDSRRSEDFPAVEMTFEMVERLVQGSSNRDALSGSGLELTGNLVEGDVTTFPGEVVVQTQNAPTLTGVSPSSGSQSGGTSVTLTGASFRAGATVAFGNVATGVSELATNVVVVSSTEITCTVPAQPLGQAGGADVTVTNNDGQAATLPSAWTYTLP